MSDNIEVYVKVMSSIVVAAVVGILTYMLINKAFSRLGLIK